LDGFLGFVVLSGIFAAVGIALIATGYGRWGFPIVLIFSGMPLVSAFFAQIDGREIRWTWRKSKGANQDG
jgi:hypothetical protein